MREGLDAQATSSLMDALRAVLRLLQRMDDRGVIIGGIAASLLGRPRLTADIDVVILLSVEQLSRLLEVASEEGFTPRIPDAVEFARRHRVLLLQHPESSIPVDISLGILPFEVEMVEHRILVDAAGLTIPVPRPEDLIILKAIAHRPVDLADIRAIAENHPTLEREYIRQWMEAFAEILEAPHLWEDIRPLLENNHERRRAENSLPGG
ncbi:MAG: nucleotidyl transferase AbiEii/AbiGii toxin family protein [Anaerolineae bacterium]